MNPKEFTQTFIVLIIAVLSACTTETDVGAERVFINGAVYTVDDDRSWAEAIAIKDGEIVFVGSNDGAKAFIGTNTIVTDLSGKMLMPSFHDAHAHVRYGGISESECNLQDELDHNKIRGLLIECRDSYDYGPDDWVLGGQWPLAAFPDANPSKDMLDEVFGNRPAYFGDSFGHNAWANSRALEIAGIDAKTPDPDQGVIVRDPETGEPTGTLRDSAMELVDAFIPSPTAEEIYQGMIAGLRKANSFGITAYTEPGSTEDSIAPLVSAADRGELTMRVMASLSPIGGRPRFPSSYSGHDPRRPWRGAVSGRRRWRNAAAGCPPRRARSARFPGLNRRWPLAAGWCRRLNRVHIAPNSCVSWNR